VRRLLLLPAEEEGVRDFTADSYFERKKNKLHVYKGAVSAFGVQPRREQRVQHQRGHALGLRKQPGPALAVRRQRPDHHVHHRLRVLEVRREAPPSVRRAARGLRVDGLRIGDGLQRKSGPVTEETTTGLREARVGTLYSFGISPLQPTGNDPVQVVEAELVDVPDGLEIAWRSGRSRAGPVPAASARLSATPPAIRNASRSFPSATSSFASG
jgi:hypothetical protein